MPYLCQNWPRYALIYMGHICWNICGRYLVYRLISLCRLCHIFAKGGPHLVGTIWAIFIIYHMGHFRVTFRLHIAVNTTSLPTEVHVWFDTFGPLLLFYMWATSGLHIFCMGHKKASSAIYWLKWPTSTCYLGSLFHSFLTGCWELILHIEWQCWGKLLLKVMHYNIASLQ